MNNLRLAPFLLFAVCVLCLPAQAQTKYTYKGDNGSTDTSTREVLTVVITERANGYEVSGVFTQSRFPESIGTCKIRGSYFRVGKRLRATCVFNDGIKWEVTGFKPGEKDAFQVKIGPETEEIQIIAWRDGIKPKTDSSSSKNASSVSGTWDFVCCSKKYKGKLNLTQTGNKINGNFGDTTNGTTGEIQGQINGAKLTFKRRWSGGTQDYDLTLSSDGKTLTGSFSGDRDKSVGTDVTATRP